MKNNVYIYQKKNRMPIWFVLALVTFISSCSESKDINELISNASIHISNESYSAAIISLKNAIQLDDKNAKTRELLADAYLAVGNYPAAEKEYRRAIQYGDLNSNIILGFGKSLNTQGKYEQVLTEEHFKSNIDKPSIINSLIVRGDANYGLGKMHDADIAYRKALKLNPKTVSALVGIASVATRDGRYKDARIYINKAEQIDKENIGLLFAQGILYYQEKNLEAAGAAFKKIIASSKKDAITYREFRAYISLITLYLKQEDLNHAREFIDMLVMKSPNHPLPKYYSAVIDYQEKNYGEAQKKLREVVDKMPDNMSAIFLLGATNYAQGNYSQADVLLTKFVYKIPTHLPARKLLTATRLKLNRPKYAYDAISPAANIEAEDIEVLMMAGMAATSMGDTAAGMQHYQQASKLNSGNKIIREELAKIYLAEGDTDKAIDELKLNSVDSDSVRTLALLSRAHLKKGEIKKAKEYIQQAVSSKADSPKLYVLLGIIELRGGNKDLAIAAFRQAENISDKYVPAMHYLAHLELENGNLFKAEEYLSRILKLQPNNLSAIFGMAHISESRNDMNQAIEWLKSAINSNADSPKAYLVLGYFYIKTKQADEAVKLIEKLEKLAEDPAISLYIARAYLLAGQPQKSIDTLKTVNAKNKMNPVIFAELAKAYYKMKDFHSARKEIDKAIDLESANIKLYLFRVKIEIDSGNSNNALNTVKKIELLFPKSKLIDELYGDVYLANKLYSKAINHYQKAISANSSVNLYLKKSKAYTRSKNIKLALMTLKKAEKIFPENKRLLFAQGNLYQLNEKPLEAIRVYEIIINDNPDDVAVLNNLAYGYINIDNKKSIKYARQAHKIAPDNVAVIDTLAWVLINNNKNDEAVAYLEEIYASTNNQSIHYHYAVGLYNLGNYDKAKKILTKLSKTKQNFNEQDEAKRLLEKLKSK